MVLEQKSISQATVWILMSVVLLGTLYMPRLKEHLPQEIPSVKSYLSETIYLNILFAPKKHKVSSSPTVKV